MRIAALGSLGAISPSQLREANLHVGQVAAAMRPFNTLLQQAAQADLDPGLLRELRRQRDELQRRLQGISEELPEITDEGTYDFWRDRVDQLRGDVEQATRTARERTGLGKKTQTRKLVLGVVGVVAGVWGLYWLAGRLR